VHCEKATSVITVKIVPAPSLSEKVILTHAYRIYEDIDEKRLVLL
jgi:hypothetical protein